MALSYGGYSSFLSDRFKWQRHIDDSRNAAQGRLLITSEGLNQTIEFTLTAEKCYIMGTGGDDYQRGIPIGRVAIEWVQFYLKEFRPILQNGDPHALFISHAGRRIQNEGVLNAVKKYAFQCGFRKHITTHSFRATCATLMFKNGADTRYVQEQLGHRRITSTERYIRLVPNDLKKIHEEINAHPDDKVRDEMLSHGISSILSI